MKKLGSTKPSPSRWSFKKGNRKRKTWAEEEGVLQGSKEGERGREGRECDADNEEDAETETVEEEEDAEESRAKL